MAAVSDVAVALHLDHVTDVVLLHRAPACGFSSVMFDAAHMGHSDNVAATAPAADFCHVHGLWLEGELGAIGGKNGAHTPGIRTDPGEAVAFTAATGLDALHTDIAVVDPRYYVETARTAVSAAVAHPLRVLHPAAVPW